MSKKDASKVLSAAARILLAWLFVLSQTAWAAQTRDTKQNPEPARKANVQQALAKESASKSVKTDTEATESAAKQNRAEEPSSGGGPHEGIKVHGHWTIEVRNPDGAVVTHREFENSLTQATGAPLLASLLNSQGQALPAPFVWEVTLSGSPGPCAGSCQIYQQAAAIICASVSCSNQSFNLATSVSGGSFVVSGTVVASASSSITSVATSTGTVPSGLNGFNIPLSQFTSATLPAAVQVSTGQTIAVTVNISFS